MNIGIASKISQINSLYAMVYVLYLDASGDPGKYRIVNSKHFVLAGIACEPQTTFACSRKLTELIEQHFPNPLIKPKKIRYYDLIHNKYPWNTIDGKKFADDFFDLILSHETTIFAMIIDKEAHWEQYAYPIPPHNLTLEMIMGRYQWFLEKNSDIGMVVSDRESRGLMKALLYTFETFKEKGTLYKELKNVIDTIFFAPSYTCPILQAADFCAYAIFSKYEHNKPDRYDQIKPNFDPYGEYKLPR